MFLISADGPDKVDHERAVIDAAVAGGVRRLVKLSYQGAEVGSELAFADWHGRIERLLRESRVPATILRASFFMSVLLASTDDPRRYC